LHCRNYTVNLPSTENCGPALPDHYISCIVQNYKQVFNLWCSILPPKNVLLLLYKPSLGRVPLISSQTS
jgi:hypothetical protein